MNAPSTKATSAPLVSCALVEKFKAVETCSEHNVTIVKGRGTFRFQRRYKLPPYISAQSFGTDRVNFNESTQDVTVATFLVTDASNATDTAISRKIHFIAVVQRGT